MLLDLAVGNKKIRSQSSSVGEGRRTEVVTLALSLEDTEELGATEGLSFPGSWSHTYAIWTPV